MTDDSNASTANVDIPEDYGAFKDFFAGKEPEAAPEDTEVEDTEADALATDEDTDASAQTEDEDLSEEDSEDEADEQDETDEESDKPEEKPEPKDKGKGKKSSAQQRINELTRARHEAERREAALLARLEALEKGQPKEEVSKEETVADRLPPGAPKPDDTDDKGNVKYPLGEYDPNFILDFAKFNVRQEIAAAEAEKTRQVAEQQAAAQVEQIRTQWAEKLDAAEEEIPDIREHIAELTETFQNVEPRYGEYLATLIMTSENGPAIMEYLSQNIGEAQKIVASGPTAATLAIGRLEARLSTTSRPAEEEKRNKKPSAAAAPPPVNKGTKTGAGTVKPDTNDLAAFKRTFFK